MKYILLIDDSQASNYLNSYLIESLGLKIKIQVCINGQDALDFLKCEGKYAHIEKYPVPAMIFLDINMPIMNGWEFLDEFENLPVPLKKELVVLMLTTSLNPTDKERAENNKYISDFLNKPLNKEKIRAILEAHADI